MSDVLEQEQLDFYGRILTEPFFADIAVLYQRKGVTENDVNRALGVFNDRGTGKLGAVIIVLMPSLQPEDPNTTSPIYDVKQTLQVIEMPLVNLGDTGTGISAEQISQRLRQIFHHFATGKGGTYVFAGMESIAVAEGQISYGVSFTRKAGDASLTRVALPSIASDSAAAPATVTITCATAGAAIWYTTDGSYPSSANAAATLYAAPFAQATAATIRAAAEKANLVQSNVRELTLS